MRSYIPDNEGKDGISRECTGIVGGHRLMKERVKRGENLWPRCFVVSSGSRVISENAANLLVKRSPFQNSGGY